MQVKTILAVLLAFLSVSHAEVIIPIGTCQNFTLLNLTDFSNYTENVCGGLANLNVTLFANSSNFSFYDAPSNSTFTALGNQTIYVFNYTTNSTNITENITYCPITSTTLAPNTTRTINNATVTCNATLPVSVPYFANFSAELTPTGADQVIANSTGIYVKVFAIPQNYCYENATQQLGQLGIYRSDRMNTTITCKVDGIISNSTLSCPPQKELFCPDTVTDCSGEVGKCTADWSVKLEAADTALATQVKESQTAILSLSGERDSAKSEAKSKDGEAKSWREAAETSNAGRDSDRLLAGLVFIAVALVYIGRKAYDIRSQNRITRDISRPSAMTGAEKENRARAGSEIGAFVRKKKMEA